MSSGTDVLDLVGGFKPVENKLKVLLKSLSESINKIVKEKVEAENEKK